MKRTFRGIFLKFTDKTSSAVPTKKDGKEIYPKVTLRVRVSSAIPFKHRICR